MFIATRRGGWSGRGRCRGNLRADLFTFDPQSERPCNVLRAARIAVGVVAAEIGAAERGITHVVVDSQAASAGPFQIFVQPLSSAALLS